MDIIRKFMTVATLVIWGCSLIPLITVTILRPDTHWAKTTLHMSNN